MTRKKEKGAQSVGTTRFFCLCVLNKHQMVPTWLVVPGSWWRLPVLAAVSRKLTELRAAGTHPCAFMQMCLYLWVSSGSRALGSQWLAEPQVTLWGVGRRCFQLQCLRRVGVILEKQRGEGLAGRREPRPRGSRTRKKDREEKVNAAQASSRPGFKLQSSQKMSACQSF